MLGAPAAPEPALAPAPPPARRAPTPRADGARPARSWGRPTLLSIALHVALAVVAVLRPAAGPTVPAAAGATPSLWATTPEDPAPEDPPLEGVEVPVELEPVPIEELTPELPEPPVEADPEEPLVLEALDVPEEPEAPSEAPFSPRLTDLRPRELRPAPPTPAAPATAAPAPPRPVAPASSAPATAAAVTGRRTPNVPRTAALARLTPPLTVFLVLTLEADGRVTDVVVERGSGAPEFDAAARAWVLAQWSFEPLAHRVRVRVPVHMRR